MFLLWIRPWRGNYTQQQLVPIWFRFFLLELSGSRHDDKFPRREEREKSARPPRTIHHYRYNRPLCHCASGISIKHFWLHSDCVGLAAVLQFRVTRAQITRNKKTCIYGEGVKVGQNEKSRASFSFIYSQRSVLRAVCFTAAFQCFLRVCEAELQIWPLITRPNSIFSAPQKHSTQFQESGWLRKWLRKPI